MKQEGWFKRCAALSAFLVMTAAASAAQVKPGDLSARQEFSHQLVKAAVEIPYPGGDVPADTGVCTDEVIRAYRAVGVDLQKEVYEDMKKNFSEYPRRAKRPDANIDHRRVANLMVFFSRKGETLAITERAKEYAPGDLVTWDLGGAVPHIGMVVDQKSLASGRYMIEHNIGRGPKIEDVLLSWKITGHYRYFGPASSASASRSDQQQAR